MEGIAYNTLFETKGMEYIVIIGFLVILIPFWLYLNKKQNLAGKAREIRDVISLNLLRTPKGLFYSNNHTWAFLSKNGLAKIGLDDFLLQIVGDVELNPKVTSGDFIKKGGLLAQINQEGKTLRFTAPISGEIHQANSSIFDNSGLLREDPYGAGWIFEIKPSDWKNETKTLYFSEEISQWMKDELNRLKDFLSEAARIHLPEPAMVVYQEGGEIPRYALSQMDEKVWNDFQDYFLK
ncbi:MAG: hypothetical protein K9G67_04325 [Bacteroidales bacterium]|nr:hypothetical protein [Bacteroidales bacterium]MCF8343406.1 hypothetical protein [Bacteroidales bacterium]MCF8349846.1 hypothetical protein [Bacteroidales bacterium]MCF8375558.1 hypothetical protein [Bacteroidales bacterium]MCF8399957.1 hypothetical protein [Bacteroidales bacterium]